MLGNINILYNNKKSGLIFGDDGNFYYFNAGEFVNFSRYQVEEGDQVEFSITKKNPGTKYDRAINIRKTVVSISGSSKSEVKPGINPKIILDSFNEDEKLIIEKLSETFYITNGGNEFQLASSTYRYCLAKPTEYFENMFHLNRELIVVFSDYIEFEPRSLDAAAAVIKMIGSKLRLERGCHILISGDSSIETKIRALFKDTNLNSIIVPFSYYEFIHKQITDVKIKERFKKHLFDVDLFYESRPIENDIFFFGRRDFAHDIANKCKNNSHCGVFGLRRSGKTSLLFAVRRLLEFENYCTVYIPCNSEISNMSWNDALQRLVKNIYNRVKSTKPLHTRDAYNDINKAKAYFEDDLNACLDLQSKPVVLMFDEIEYITFYSSIASDGWKNGRDYVEFWNAIRGYCLKYTNKISIVVAGTNPMMNEIPNIEVSGKSITNPMFGQLSQSNQGAYLPPFDISSASNMVNTLGGYMGVIFDENVCAKMTSDCGGHPYLIRLLCKHINTYIQEKKFQRPKTVTHAIYEKVRPEFEKSSDAQGFYQMILLILQESFSKEYNVLKLLATKKDEYIADTQDQNSLIHLLGYGIIDYNAGQYSIKFETIQRYLEGKYKFEIVGLSAEEKRKEINYRCNAAEMTLRKNVRRTLQTFYGKAEAKKKVINAMKNNPAASKFADEAERKLDYPQLFDPSVNGGLYFSVLKDIICNNYNCFNNVFEGARVDQVKDNLKIINEARRAPAHSYDEDSVNWTEEEFEQFRKSMSWIEGYLSNYED